MPSNVTLDDTSPEIVYTGSWDGTPYPSSLSFNGTHRLSYDPAAKATLEFKGIAVYFWSPLWPYLVNTTITLDNETTVVLDLTDYDNIDKPDIGLVETQQTAVRWSRTGLEDKNHTLVAGMLLDPEPATYLVFDAVTYTVSYQIPSPGAKRAKTLAVALGTCLALAAVAAIGLALYFWFFLRGTKKWRDWRRRGAHARVQDSSFNLETEFPKQRGSVWVEPTPPHLIAHPYSFSRTTTSNSRNSELESYSPWVGMGPLASRVRVDELDPTSDPFIDRSRRSQDGWQTTPTIDDDMDDDPLNSAGGNRSARPLPPGAAVPYMFVSNRADDDDDDAASVASSSSTRTRVQEGPYANITPKSDNRSRQS